MIAGAEQHKPQAADCPGAGKLLRKCSACQRDVNLISSTHVVVMPSWHRCNDILCRECWTRIMTAASVIITAEVRGARVWVEEPLEL